MQPRIDVNGDRFTPRPDLDKVIEEADCRIIPHVEKAALHGIERVIVYSNDTYVVVYLLCYNHHFINADIKELWLRYGVAKKTRCANPYVAQYLGSRCVGHYLRPTYLAAMLQVNLVQKQLH